MKPRILKYLCCPKCGKGLKLKSGREVNGEIKSGKLICGSGHNFLIIRFIPRFVSRSNFSSGKKQVQASFSEKWAKWRQFNDWYKRFFEDWFMKKIGIADKAGFARYFSRKKMMLDAGTGLGTKVETMCRLSEGEVLGIDIAEGSVENAFRNTKKFSNAHIIQADLFNLPFKKGIFDFIVSDGVLHHTPDTRKAFLSLVPFLSKGGDIAIHVYKKIGPIREFTDDFIRRYASKLTPEEVYKFCKPFTKLGKSLDEMNAEITVPEDIPVLEIKAGRYPLQRFIYYMIFQCFWNPNLSFRDNNLVNYDWFHPKYAWRHTPEEVKNWFKEAKLKKIRQFITNESGVSIMAQR